MINQPNKKLNVLSLFDGIACSRVALERAGFEINNYYASEVDPYAIKIASKNFPDIMHVGDVREIKGTNFKDIDILMGGSPCTGFSFSGKQLNFKDPQSKLFFEFVRILKEIKPKYFLLENVRMKQEYQDVISEHLGVKPIAINSSLLSAQNRYRLYWTNIPNITQPKDKGLLLKNILEDEVDEKYYLSDKIQKRFKLTKPSHGALDVIGTTKGETNTRIGTRDVVYGKNGKMGTLMSTDYKQPKQICNEIGKIDIKGFDSIKRVYSEEGKSPTLTSMQGGYRHPKILENPVAIAQRGRNIINGKRQDIKGAKTEQRLETNFNEKSNCLTTVQKDSLVLEPKGIINRVRRITPTEAERLQTLDDNFTEGISDSQRYKVLGNGFTVDVISWILSFMKFD